MEPTELLVLKSVKTKINGQKTIKHRKLRAGKAAFS